MTEDRHLKCYLSYTSDQATEVEKIVNLLQQFDVDTFTAHDIEPGQPISSTMLSALREADFVCVILSDASPSANIAFELGVATGLGKAVLALFQDICVPFDLAHNIQLVRWKDGDPSSVLPDVRRFVRHIRPKPEPSPSQTAQYQASVENAAAKLNQLRQATNAQEKGRALEDIVAHLFAEPHWEVLREEAFPNHTTPDLLLWSDSIVAQLGGPLIIECKYYRGGLGSVLTNARHALKQLQSYVEKTNAGLGLLVFYHDRPKDLNLSQYDSPKALSFYVGDLIETVRAAKLTDEIWRRRARAGRLKGLADDGG